MSKRPNIIQIVADDMGIGDLSAFNNYASDTHRLDRLLDEGVYCERSYSSSAVCMPARATLMTGLYPQRVGTVDYAHHRPYDFMDPTVPTIADHLRVNGYATGCIGKWHLGSGPLDPHNRGFAETLVFHGGLMDYWGWSLLRNGRFHVPADGRYLTDVFSDEAVGFVRRHRDEPFFLHLAYSCPHSPYQAHEADVRDFREMGRWNETVSTLYGMIRAMDRGIGRLLDELDRLGLAEDTLVMFVSDNGPVQDARLQRVNQRLRGGKTLIWEGGIRVPAIYRWPAGGVGGGRTVETAVHFTDVFPTLLEAAGVDARNHPELDGDSLLGLLRGEDAPAPRVRCWQWTRYEVVPFQNAAVSDGRWKLVYPVHGNFILNSPGNDRIHALALRYCNAERPDLAGIELPDGFSSHAEHRDYLTEILRRPKPAGLEAHPAEPQLYDLQSDPGESTDRAGAEPERVAELRETLDRWFDDVLPQAEQLRSTDPYHEEFTPA